MAEHINVFMSSTSRDLPEYRKFLFDIITGLDMFPIGMEHFQPTADNAMQVCYDAVQKAEVFFGLYAFRYGFVPPPTMSYEKADKSIANGDNITGVTEWEYIWAREQGIPILLFIVADDAYWKQNDIEEGVGRERLKEFKARISGSHVVRYFKDLAEFRQLAPSALSAVKQELDDKRLSDVAMRTQSLKEITKAEESATKLASAQLFQSQQEAKKHIKFVGILPKNFGNNTFHDREDQQAKINNLLLKGGVVSIYGQQGIGKTGLVCKVIGDIEKSENAPDGRVFIRAEKSLTIDHIIGNFAKILPGSNLPTGQENNALSHRQKSEALLEALTGGHYLLVIDNAEDLQDEQSHKLLDPALETFLETVLDTKGNNGALTVLITSRMPIQFKPNLKTKELLVPLDEGLPGRDARAFLRELDLYKRLPAEDAALDNLIKRLRGFPHSLEAAVGWLNNNSTRDLENLLAELPDDPELMPFLVEKAQNTLPEAFQKVIQAIAIVGIGMTEQAIPKAILEYLLAPYIDIQQFQSLLDRLVQARFIIFNESSRSYSLHPFDREQALKSIPQGTKNDHWKPLDPARYRRQNLRVPENLTPDWTHYALNKRMAEFYSEQRVEEPQSISDLQPQLREFEHRFANQDYDVAAEILLNIDFNFLLLWGYNELVLDLHSRLQGLITNPQLAQNSAGNLGSAHRNIGQVEKSIGYYEKALEMARSQNDLHGEAVWLGNLGLAYSDLGQIDKAISYSEQALVISQKIRDKLNEVAWLGNLGVSYMYLGKIDKAIAYYEQQLALARKINNRGGEGRALGNLGLTYKNLGQIDKAFQYAEQALIIDREIKDIDSEATQLGNLGNAYIYINDYKKALSYLKESLKIADKIKSPAHKSFMGSYLAQAYFYSGDITLAFDTIQIVRQYDVPYYNHAVATIHGVIALTAKEDAEAKTAFADALRLADELLAKTSSLFETIYYRAIAHLGAFTCGGDDSHLEQARADIARAKSIFAGEGVVNQMKRLVEALNRAAGQTWDIGL